MAISSLFDACEITFEDVRCMGTPDGVGADVIETVGDHVLIERCRLCKQPTPNPPGPDHPACGGGPAALFKRVKPNCAALEDTLSTMADDQRLFVRRFIVDESHCSKRLFRRMLQLRYPDWNGQVLVGFNSNPDRYMYEHEGPFGGGVDGVDRRVVGYGLDRDDDAS